MNLEKGLKKYEKLKRDEYFEKNQELSQNLWEKEDLPTVADICDVMKGKESKKLNKIFDFFDNRENFLELANRKDNNYDEEESSTHITTVKSSNSTEISESGYFYKLLMASADDFLLDPNTNNCKSEGVEYNLNSLTEKDYNYRVKFMYINEIKDFTRMNYEDFMNFIKDKDIQSIHVRTPLTCKCIKNRCLCKKCAGILPSGITNIGTFITLMVTESATQSALSSMNKGVTENVNKLLERKYEGIYDWEEIKKWMEEIVSSIQNDQVSARFYEIALLSRVREDKKGPFVASLKNSINHSDNLFGSYIFRPNLKNFERMVRKGHFEDNSLKLQIAMNNFKKKE